MTEKTRISHWLWSSTITVIIGFYIYWLLCPIYLFEDPSNSVKSQHVIVTGASQGIGRSLVFEYAKRGAAQIVIAARNQMRLEEVATSARELYPQTIIYVVPADLSTEENSYKLINDALKLMDNKLDTLLLNHITSSHFGPWLGHSDKSFVEEMFRVNTFSYIWMATAAMDSLSQSPTGGHIGVVSSLAGHVGIPKTSVYGATKHALHGFFNAYRAELAYVGKTNMGVTLCAIGATETEGAANVKHLMSSSIQWDSAEWAAEAIVRGVASKRREIFHPQHVVFPAVQIYRFFPAFLDRILLAAQEPAVAP